MKTKAPLLTAVFVFSLLNVFSVDLKNAIANKQIMVELAGSDYSTMPASVHSGDLAPKMQMEVHNLGNTPIEIELDPGYMLEAAEPGYQAMLLAQPIAITIGPKSKKMQYLFALCTQLTNSGPNPSLHYHVAEKAGPGLLQMALLIANKKYFIHAAQDAVWSITNEMPETAIATKDTNITNDLLQKVADAKGMSFAEMKKKIANAPKTLREALEEFNGQKLDRNFVFTVQDTAHVEVGLYDNNGHLISTLFKNSLFKEGKHCIRYNPYPLALAGKRYSVRMFRDGAAYKEYYFMQ